MSYCSGELPMCLSDYVAHAQKGHLFMQGDSKTCLSVNEQQPKISLPHVYPYDTTFPPEERFSYRG